MKVREVLIWVASSTGALVWILLLTSLLRLVDLTGVPNGFHADEVSIGYDTYSMLKTGRDQYGEFLPPDLSETTTSCSFAS